MSDDLPVPVSMTSAEVRSCIVDALRLDLVGPGPGHEHQNERLPGWIRPSNWYHTGFLIPSSTPPEKSADQDEDDDFDVVPKDAGLSEEANEERKTAKKGYLPSSMGLSFLVAEATRTLEAVVTWGDYTSEDNDDPEVKQDQVWQRHPRREVVAIDATPTRSPRVIDVPDSGGLQLHVVVRPLSTDGRYEEIPRGTRSVSVFLVNHRPPDEDTPDLAYVFQPRVEIHSKVPIVPRPDLRGARSEDRDEAIGDLHYADTPEYATGHGVAADWDLVDSRCQKIRTIWIPEATVERTETHTIDGLDLSMDALGALPDGAAAEAALTPLVVAYRSWIEEQTARAAALTGRRADTATQLLQAANYAAGRIERGIAVLRDDADALDAFRVANRAVSRALKKRLPDVDKPAWRAFQLAFQLLNLSGLADPTSADRKIVDLLFFPTGGGKTEAYLGLAAFTLVLRRLRHREDDGIGGAGVGVIMRYTLRLLTLDQLGRAAGLVCALELERQDNVERYGTWPFEIGLWVGKAATPNRMGRKGDKSQDTARAKTSQYKGNPQRNPSPIPLENCPWCGKPFTADSFHLVPDSDNPRDLRVYCASPDLDCEFGDERPLPIVAVDDVIYRRLPAFLIATVDKFASLPWVGPSGALLGGADRHDDQGFYGPADSGRGRPLEHALPPPDLVIQDELHLISGPLGTMAGLYETAIEALCLREFDGKTVRPKIVASTATVRAAQEQIQALFARPLTQIFPPPGPDRRDSFFARTQFVDQVPGRLYLGVAGPGRNPKLMMRKVWTAIMGAAERCYRDLGGHENQTNPADPYMTALGYFCSLKELGSARRILEEEIQVNIKNYGERRRIGEARGLFQDRRTFSEVVELTSRVSTNKVAEAKRRLESPFHDIDQRVDCAIATNMISVGLDIPRLGLMIVLGQPKSHAEYIQATSRVGRDRGKPGLVVTLFNVHKPRDRSQYERFRHYHETFYRSVEVGSVTPYSARALDRGFAGAMVSLARHGRGVLTPPAGVRRLAEVRGELEDWLVDVFVERVKAQKIPDPDERDQLMSSVRNRVVDLLDSWQAVVDDYEDVGAKLQYQPYELRDVKPLLHDLLETTFDSHHEAKFRVNRSLRDVEPSVNLYLRELSDAVREVK